MAIHSQLAMCRSQLCYLSCQGCMQMGDSICEGLESCLALDLSNLQISDKGLQKLYTGVRPPLCPPFTHAHPAIWRKPWIENWWCLHRRSSRIYSRQ